MRSPWVSGSFYLVAILAILSVLLAAGAILPWWVVPLVVVGGVVGVALVGALQLRQDARLSQESFLRLMSVALSHLPPLTKRSNENRP
jgi:hypothetical protein